MKRNFKGTYSPNRRELLVFIDFVLYSKLYAATAVEIKEKKKKGKKVVTRFAFAKCGNQCAVENGHIYIKY